jgi:hypothetical protein
LYGIVKIEEQATIYLPKRKEIALSEKELGRYLRNALGKDKVSSLLWVLASYTGRPLESPHLIRKQL